MRRGNARSVALACRTAVTAALECFQRCKSTFEVPERRPMDQSPQALSHTVQPRSGEP